MAGCERGRDRGFVTAESAVVLPVLVVFATALVYGLLVVAAQIRCVDAKCNELPTDLGSPS